MDRVAAKRFSDLGTARDWIFQTFIEWEAELSTDEREALNEYKRQGYAEINETLRFWDLPYIDHVVHSLDTALAKMRLPEPIIAWRGLAGFGPVLQGLVGDVVGDDGYWSTSLLRSVAEGFIAHEPEEAVLVELAIPGDAIAGAFTAAPDLVADLGEVEILLPRGSMYRVVDTRQEGDDRIVELEAIP